LAGVRSSSLDWADLAVVPLIAVLSVPSLLWFGHHWTVIHNDAARYLLAGSKLVSDPGLEARNGISHINHGPGFPALIGALILVFGRDTETLVWTVRLIALVNPLLAYFLGKRISGSVTGLISAALVTLFGYNATLNIDALMLTFYLLALLALLAAIKRNSSLLALLSGLLLGAAILTKETAFANLPLALLAVLLLNWDLRKALWHYLGVVLVSLPWWIRVWLVTGKVYLVDRLPASFQVPVMIGTAIVLGVCALAYASGMLTRFLADERRRRWAGWFVVIAWTILLSGLLLATTAPALAKLSVEHLRLYLAHLLAPSIIVVPVLLLANGYVIWKAAHPNAPWTLLALALLFQVPVCLLVTVEGWAPRQFLIPQTLMFCALAALVAAASAVAWQGRSYSGQLIAAVIAATLAILLLASSVERILALLSQNPAGLSEQERRAPQATEMIDWMAENIPEGKHILVAPALDKYLIFLDGGRHEWRFLHLDQGPCEPRPNIQIGCKPNENNLSRIPPDAVWIQMMGDCKVISLSMSHLSEQVGRTGSDYVMISGDYKYSGILGLPSLLQGSGAFKVVHAEGRSGVQGVVLLKSTGQSPNGEPTLMNANTLHSLARCEQARGPGDEKMIRSEFPNGILKVSISS
jgi:4-amino-4-deoxy-L-arabinose transferase-like glycosyltransferase